MKKTTTITLGEHTIAIGMLPIGILRDLDVELAGKAEEGATDKEKEEFSFDQTIRIISYGLSTADSKWTVEAVRALPVNSSDEIFEARTKILLHSGLVKLRTTESGEEKAGAS